MVLTTFFTCGAVTGQFFGLLPLQIRVHGAAQVHHPVERLDVENRHRPEARMLLEDMPRTSALICASPGHPENPHFRYAAQPDKLIAAAIAR